MAESFGEEDPTIPIRIRADWSGFDEDVKQRESQPTTFSTEAARSSQGRAALPDYTRGSPAAERFAAAIERQVQAFERMNQIDRAQQTINRLAAMTTPQLSEFAKGGRVSPFGEGTREMGAVLAGHKTVSWQYREIYDAFAKDLPDEERNALAFRQEPGGSSTSGFLYRKDREQEALARMQVIQQVNASTPPGPVRDVRYGKALDYSDQDVARFLKHPEFPTPDDQLRAQLSRASTTIIPPPPFTLPQQPVDPAFHQAVQSSLEYGSASISNIRRELSIGYTRAKAIVDQMIQTGIAQTPTEPRAPAALRITQSQYEIAKAQQVLPVRPQVLEALATFAGPPSVPKAVQNVLMNAPEGLQKLVDVQNFQVGRFPSNSNIEGGRYLPHTKTVQVEPNEPPESIIHESMHNVAEKLTNRTFLQGYIDRVFADRPGFRDDLSDKLSKQSHPTIRGLSGYFNFAEENLVDHLTQYVHSPSSLKPEIKDLFDQQFAATPKTGDVATTALVFQQARTADVSEQRYLEDQRRSLVRQTRQSYDLGERESERLNIPNRPYTAPRMIAGTVGGESGLVRSIGDAGFVDIPPGAYAASWGGALPPPGGGGGGGSLGPGSAGTPWLWGAPPPGAGGLGPPGVGYPWWRQGPFNNPIGPINRPAVHRGVGVRGIFMAAEIARFVGAVGDDYRKSKIEEAEALGDPEKLAMSDVHTRERVASSVPFGIGRLGVFLRDPTGREEIGVTGQLASAKEDTRRSEVMFKASNVSRSQQVQTDITAGQLGITQQLLTLEEKRVQQHLKIKEASASERVEMEKGAKQREAGIKQDASFNQNAVSRSLHKADGIPVLGAITNKLAMGAEFTDWWVADKRQAAIDSDVTRHAQSIQRQALRARSADEAVDKQVNIERQRAEESNQVHQAAIITQGMKSIVAQQSPTTQGQRLLSYDFRRQEFEFKQREERANQDLEFQQERLETQKLHPDDYTNVVRRQAEDRLALEHKQEHERNVEHFSVGQDQRRFDVETRASIKASELGTAFRPNEARLYEIGFNRQLALNAAKPEEYKRINEVFDAQANFAQADIRRQQNVQNLAVTGSIGELNAGLNRDPLEAQLRRVQTQAAIQLAQLPKDTPDYLRRKLQLNEEKQEQLTTQQYKDNRYLETLDLKRQEKVTELLGQAYGPGGDVKRREAQTTGTVLGAEERAQSILAADVNDQANADRARRIGINQLKAQKAEYLEGFVASEGSLYRTNLSPVGVTSSPDAILSSIDQGIKELNRNIGKGLGAVE